MSCIARRAGGGINAFEHWIFIPWLGRHRHEMIVVPSQVQFIADHVSCHSWLGVLRRREEFKMTSRECAFYLVNMSNCCHGPGDFRARLMEIQKDPINLPIVQHALCADPLPSHSLSEDRKGKHATSHESGGKTQPYCRPFNGQSDHKCLFH